MATDVEAATAATVTAAFSAKRKQFAGVFSEVITAKVVFDEDSIAAAKASQGDFTIPGAALGDVVLVTSTIDPVYLLVTGKVKSDGVVTISVLNQDSTDASTSFSGAPTLNVFVLKLNADIFGN